MRGELDLGTVHRFQGAVARTLEVVGAELAEVPVCPTVEDALTAVGPAV